jgi:HrpA-like RNA helicase
MSINERQTYKDVDKEIPDKMWRPKWDDVLVVYLIEKIVNRYVWDFRDSPLTRINPPYSVFDAYVYHALLRKARDAATSDTVPNAVAPTRALAVDAVEPEVVERPSLPIDEFETDILASVRKHRVTIVQGETGCGEHVCVCVNFA